ncbi:uncharacterized protein EI90DRAFT_3016712 [Cantharellus anzutake]|uniref:uncharacterized protein n=1 Tax=Cantharellus anzutake TaxID=1750568 RepID=UPI00190362A5|nr:uncharacterized protein EI90DRAFT_3016712 [Cantharellus anzutake]KAF8330911.1 hypothetical protein EI90DRAFT_3016712 [Cantharellus anzutake]
MAPSDCAYLIGGPGTRNLMVGPVKWQWGYLAGLVPGQPYTIYRGYFPLCLEEPPCHDLSSTYEKFPSQMWNDCSVSAKDTFLSGWYENAGFEYVELPPTSNDIIQNFNNSEEYTRAVKHVAKRPCPPMDLSEKASGGTMTQPASYWSGTVLLAEVPRASYWTKGVFHRPDNDIGLLQETQTKDGLQRDLTFVEGAINNMLTLAISSTSLPGKRDVPTTNSNTLRGPPRARRGDTWTGDFVIPGIRESGEWFGHRGGVDEDWREDAAHKGSKRVEDQWTSRKGPIGCESYGITEELGPSDMGDQLAHLSPLGSFPRNFLGECEFDLHQFRPFNNCDSFKLREKLKKNRLPKKVIDHALGFWQRYHRAYRHRLSQRTISHFQLDPPKFPAPLNLLMATTVVTEENEENASRRTPVNLGINGPFPTYTRTLVSGNGLFVARVPPKIDSPVTT